jgi:hypothetical protein
MSRFPLQGAADSASSGFCASLGDSDPPATQPLSSLPGGFSVSGTLESLASRFSGPRGVRRPQDAQRLDRSQGAIQGPRAHAGPRFGLRRLVGLCAPHADRPPLCLSGNLLPLFQPPFHYLLVLLLVSAIVLAEFASERGGAQPLSLPHGSVWASGRPQGSLRRRKRRHAAAFQGASRAESRAAFQGAWRCSWIAASAQFPNLHRAHLASAPFAKFQPVKIRPPLGLPQRSHDWRLRAYPRTPAARNVITAQAR